MEGTEGTTTSQHAYNKLIPSYFIHIHSNIEPCLASMPTSTTVGPSNLCMDKFLQLQLLPSVLLLRPLPPPPVPPPPLPVLPRPSLLVAAAVFTSYPAGAAAAFCSFPAVVDATLFFYGRRCYLLFSLCLLLR